MPSSSPSTCWCGARRAAAQCPLAPCLRCSSCGLASQHPSSLWAPTLATRSLRPRILSEQTRSPGRSPTRYAAWEVFYPLPLCRFFLAHSAFCPVLNTPACGGFVSCLPCMEELLPESLLASHIEHIMGVEQAWYMNPAFSVLVGGILPFGAVFIELFFILTSMWLHQFYYLFGFLCLVFVILIITCAEITIVLCYFQLCSEDYHWW